MIWLLLCCQYTGSASVCCIYNLPRDCLLLPPAGFKTESTALSAQGTGRVLARGLDTQTLQVAASGCVALHLYERLLCAFGGLIALLSVHCVKTLCLLGK
jgi:hypothetical protein